MMVKKLDDMDVAFGYGAIFGASIMVLTFSVKKIVRIIKIEKNMRRITSALFAEIDESLKNNSEY